MKTVKVAIEFDSNSGKIVAVNGELKKLKSSVDDVNSAGSKLGSIFAGARGKLLAFAGVAGVFYSIGKAVGFVVKSGLAYNRAMDATTAKLTAMVRSGRAWETLSGQKVNAMQREGLVAKEVAYTMGLLKRANADTAMGMSELVDVYALAKPGMDRMNWTLKDQIEILKLVTNAASNFDVGSEELATGIDDLATGTWDANSGFGKMMKTLGITKEEFAAATNKVEFLKEKLKDVGQMGDTWSVAVSNMGVAWDELTGKVTAPIFDIAKEGVKELTKWLNAIDSSEVNNLRDSLVTTVRAGVVGAGYLAQAWDGVRLVITVIEAAYAEFGLIANKSMQAVSDGMAKAVNASWKYWASFKNKFKVLWHDIISYVANKWNSLLGSLGNSKFGKFIADKFGFNFDKLSIDITPPELDSVKDIVKPADFSSGIGYYQRKLIIAKNEEFNLYNSILNKDKIKAANEFAAKIDKIAQKYKNAKKEVKALTKATKLANKPTKSLAKSAKAHHKALKAHHKALKDNNSEAKKLAKESKKIADEAKRAKDEWVNIFNGGLQSILHGDFKGGFNGILTGIEDKLTKPLIAKFSNYLGGELQSLTAGLSPMVSGAIGAGISLLGSLFKDMFSSTVSEAEKKAAAGRVEFSDNSIKNLSNAFDNVMYPHLKLTQDIRDATRGMNKNFYAIAKAIAGTSSSIDLTGQGYVPTQESGFLGFSSESRQLLGTGVELGGTLKNSWIKGYLNELVHEESFWGLVSDTYIKETEINIPNKTKQAVAKVLQSGVKSILESAVVLGFDRSYIASKIEQYKIKIGRINLKGLSQKEAADRLNSAFSEIFSDAIGGVGELVSLTDRYAKSAEQRMQTLARIAVEYEQASYAFDLINKKIDDTSKTIRLHGILKWFTGFGDFLTVVYTKQEKILDIVSAIGGADKFKDAYSSLLENYYTKSEQLKMESKKLSDIFESIHIKMPKTKKEFRELLDGFKISNKEDAKRYATLLNINGLFAHYINKEKELAKVRGESLQKQLDFEKDKLQKLQDFWTGSLSYLNSFEKIAKLESFKNGSNDTDIALKQLEYQMKMSRTKEEYALSANRYVYDLQNKKPDATLKDVVKSNEDIKVEIAELKQKVGEVANLQVEADKEIAKDTLTKLDKIERATSSRLYEVAK